jgi:hypothetical protein
MSKAGKTEVVVILDQSGSMDPLKNDAIGGFNNFLESQKKLNAGECLFTLVLFNDGMTTVTDAQDIKFVSPLNDVLYVPNSSTALYDAMALTIGKVRTRYENTDEAEQPDTIIFATLTDGENNSSRKFNKQEVIDLVADMKTKYGWAFIYLATDIDSFKDGASMGPAVAATLYSNDSVGIQSLYSDVNEITCSVRTASANRAWKGTTNGKTSKES